MSSPPTPSASARCTGRPLVLANAWDAASARLVEEAGYGLDPAALAERLLGAGAVGCNLEDTDNHGGGVLVPADAQADRIRAMKDAGRAAGVDLVVNVRVDTFLRKVDDPVAETVRRGRLYLDSGADSVFPIMLVDPETIRALVAELGAVAVIWRPGGPSPADLAACGVVRISVGSALFRLGQASTRASARLLALDAPDG